MRNLKPENIERRIFGNVKKSKMITDFNICAKKNDENAHI